MRRTHILGVVLLAFSVFCSAADVKDLPSQAIEKSQLTSLGSRPFHIRIRVFEATNPENEKYKAEIEEYWVTPEKWRRTIKANGFSETLVVNGSKSDAQIAGDYYPHWLRVVVNAVFDPGAPLQGLDMGKSGDNPVIGGTQLCRRFSFRTGIPPVSNRVFSSFCFERGLLDSAMTPSYHAEYKDYRGFAGKQVARTIREYLEPGEEVGATIEQLSELTTVDENLFSLQQTRPPLDVAVVPESTLRGIASSAPEIQWPKADGKQTGVLSLWVSIDQSGSVREVYGLNSDNPHMTAAARDQVMKWRFKPALNKGVPVQVESIVSFAFDLGSSPAR